MGHRRGLLSGLMMSLVSSSGFARFEIDILSATRRSVEVSKKVSASEFEKESQQEKVRSAWGDVGPRVKLDYNQTYYDRALGNPPVYARPEETRVGSITVIQPITPVGAAMKNAFLQEDLEDLRELDLQLTKSKVKFETAELWLKCFQSLEQVRILKSSLEAALSQQKDGASLERVGRLSKGDLLKLDHAVSEAQSKLATAKAESAKNKADLALRLGLPVQEDLELSGGLPQMTEKEQKLEEALNEAFMSRVELKRSLKNEDVAEFQKSLVISTFVPVVSVFAKFDRNFGESFSGQFQDRKNAQSYGINATWEIWGNGGSIFNYRAAARQVGKAEEERKTKEEEVTLEVYQSLTQLGASKENLSLAKVAVTQATEAYRIEQARFRAGSKSSTDVILAEATQATAQGRLLAAEVDFVLSQLRLQKALGRDEPAFGQKNNQ